MELCIVRDIVQDKDQASMVWMIRELTSAIVKALLLHHTLPPVLPLAPSNLLQPLQLLGQPEGIGNNTQNDVRRYCTMDHRPTAQY